jgi:hypothetical protein
MLILGISINIFKLNKVWLIPYLELSFNKYFIRSISDRVVVITQANPALWNFRAVHRRPHGGD